MCKQVGLQWADLEEMTIGMCFDYIEEHLSMINPKRQKMRARRATQEDFDRF